MSCRPRCAHIGDVRRPVGVAQQAVEHVENDHRPGVADMGEVVDRRPADIHPHMGRIDRHEVLLGARAAVL